jgi:hypothetical protein
MTTATEQVHVRVTLDLDADLHREMKLWAVQNGPRVTLANVYRALSDELLTNPKLAEVVLARIRGQ